MSENNKKAANKTNKLPESDSGAKEKLGEESSLKLIIDSLPMVCGLHDKNYNLIDCNQAAVRLFGVKNKQEYLDRYIEFASIVQPDGTDPANYGSKNMDDAFRNGQARFDWTFKKANGTKIRAEVTIISTKWKSEDALLSIIHDMTDYHKYRETERLNQQRVQALLDSCPVACMVSSDAGEVLEVNRKLLELFGVDSKQEYLDNIRLLSPPNQPDGRDSGEKGMAMLAQAYETGSSHFEWMHQDLSGEDIPCEMSIVRVELEDRFLVLAYMRDLRELKGLVAMKEHLETLAFTDALTNIYNRRYFFETAERELQESNASDQQFSILMIDIDRFKLINDQYGHQIGDEVLKILAKRVKKVLRPSAVLARYGGEEFIVMLKRTNVEDATTTAWRILKTVERSAFSIEGQRIKVTVSVGVAAKTSPEQSLSNIIEKADTALYQAKNAGRNTVARQE